MKLDTDKFTSHDNEQHTSPLDSTPDHFPSALSTETLINESYGYALILVAVVSLVALTIWLILPDNQKLQSIPEKQYYAPTSSSEPILPIPLTSWLNKEKVALGERLFIDPRLSSDDTIACIHCHNLSEAGGADFSMKSRGINGELGEVNSPTVFNVAMNSSFFWDGRAATLEEQIDGPIHNPKEMGTSWPDVIKKLQADPLMVSRFDEIYPDGINADNIKDAIAEFERSLITPNSRFDLYLRGDDSALTADELKGYQLFKDYGCIACHQGVNVGGNMFQLLGIMRDYFKDRGGITTADLGRYNVTGKDEDRHYFRVPPLRNIALTAPYFHDGTAKTLEDAIAVMAKYQLGREMADDEIKLIAAFLGTLTGEYQGKAL